MFAQAIGPRGLNLAWNKENTVTRRCKVFKFRLTNPCREHPSVRITVSLILRLLATVSQMNREYVFLNQIDMTDPGICIRCERNHCCAEYPSFLASCVCGKVCCAPTHARVVMTMTNPCNPNRTYHAELIPEVCLWDERVLLVLILFKARFSPVPPIPWVAFSARGYINKI